jgi:hypothetical protein
MEHSTRRLHPLTLRDLQSFADYQQAVDAAMVLPER